MPENKKKEMVLVNFWADLWILKKIYKELKKRKKRIQWTQSVISSNFWVYKKKLIFHEMRQLQHPNIQMENIFSPKRICTEVYLQNLKKDHKKESIRYESLFLLLQDQSNCHLWGWEYNVLGSVVIAVLFSLLSPLFSDA